MSQKPHSADTKEIERILKKHAEEYERGLHEVQREAMLASRLFLMNLQHFMLAVYDGRLANSGSFCSYCYGPIAHEAITGDWRHEPRCPHCSANRNDYALVGMIPAEILRIYHNREARARRMMDVLSLAGLAVGIIIGGWLFLNIQDWTRFLACLTPIITGIIVTAVGGSLGAKRVIRTHDREWLEFVAKRGDKSTAAVHKHPHVEGTEIEEEADLPSLQSAFTQEARIIHFPPDRSMGRLMMMDHRDALYDWPSVEAMERVFVWDFAPAIEARGDMTVPMGKEAWLRMSSEASTDLSPLAALNPSDVQVLVLEKTRVSDAGLAHLHRLTELQELYLGETQISDGGMPHLQALAALQELWLAKTRVSDAGLVNLKGLTQLRVLDLSGTRVGGAGLAHVVDLTELKWLYLKDTDVGDAHLAHLRRLTKLTDVNLTGTQITDAGLMQLRSLSAPKSLSLSYTQVTGLGLAHLRELRSLSTLWLDGTAVGDEGLTHLEGLTWMQWLDLSHTRVSDVGLPHLRGLARLEVLSLKGTEISDAGLANLQGLTALRELQLGETHVSDAGLVHLEGLRALRLLDLTCTQVGDAGLVNLHGMSELEFLYLERTLVTDAGLNHLRGLTGLKKVNLWGTQVSAEGRAMLKSALPDCIVIHGQ